jgi:sarcosine oxidase, subunit gamma
MLLNKDLEMIDLSMHAALGIKGSYASAWLEQQGIEVPSAPNYWIKLNQNCMVLRLGMNEFLIQEVGSTINQEAQALIVTLENNLSNVMEDYAGVYRVPRADASLLLKGDGVAPLLSQMCRLNIEQDIQGHALVMTQVAGVSAILLKESEQGNVYKLLFDLSYQAYMTETIANLAKVNIDFELVS